MNQIGKTFKSIIDADPVRTREYLRRFYERKPVREMSVYSFFETALEETKKEIENERSS